MKPGDRVRRLSMALGVAAIVAGAAAESTQAQEAADYIAQGEQMLQWGNQLGAAYKFELAIQKEPSNIEAHLKLAKAYTEMGNTYGLYFGKAESTYARVASLAGKDHVGYRKGVAELSLAQWHVDDAMAIYERLASDHPDNCSYVLLLSEAQRLKGLQIQESEGRDASMAQLGVAENTVRKAMGLCPGSIEPIRALAQIKDTQKNYQEVVDLYAEEFKKHPENVELLRGYATALFNLRDWERAAQYLSQLLEKDPRVEERLMYISALRKVNRLDEAKTQEEIARKEYPVVMGPQELRPEDILKQKLGIRECSERAVQLLEGTPPDCAGAVEVWKACRAKVEPYLQDETMKSAAEDLIVWLDSRILYAEGKCK